MEPLRPVLCEAPCGCHPYISHSYITTRHRPPGFPLALAPLLCFLPRSPLRNRLLRGPRAEPEPVEVVEIEPSWLDKLRRACGLRRFDVVARIAVSLKDTETAMQMVHALAFECLKHRAFFLTAVLKEFRLLNVAPELGLELYRKTQLWFRAQGPIDDQWDEVVYALVLADEYQEAWDLVRSMEDASDLPAPSLATYAILLLPTCLNEGPRAANQILALLRSRGQLNSVHHLIMAAFYARDRNIGMARAHMRQGERLIRHMRAKPQRETEEKQLLSLQHLFATLMAGYRRLGRLQDCFTLLGVVQQHAVKPDNVFFAILQQACWNHLDATGEVRQILRLMEDLEVPPQISNYNALIKTYGDSGQFTNALQVANRLREAGVAWDEFTFTYLLDAAVSAGQVELAVRLLSQMRNDGVRPGSRQYITVFLGLAQAGHYEDAIRVFERLVSLGSCGTQAFNVMIGIHCQRNSMSAALTIMERMREAGVGPDVTSWRILLTGYAFAGQYEEILELESAFTTFRQNLQMALGPQATDVARKVAKEQLKKQREWTKVYDILMDAALWNGQWSRAVALLKDLVDLGFPVDLLKHRRLVQDLKEFYPGKDLAIGMAAEVIPVQPFVAEEQTRKWLAQVPDSSRTSTGSSARLASETVLDHISLQAFAASFSPHWLDGARQGPPLPELCRKMLFSEDTESLDASTAYEILNGYYHATVHRRSVIPMSLAHGQQIHVRSGMETVSSLRQLFELYGWPADDGPRYVFLRPNGFTLDAFLLVLGLAASYPQSLLVLREAEDSSTEVGQKVADATTPLPVTKQSLQRKWSRALTVTIGATIRTLPAALLLNSRTLVATGDLNASCTFFEKKLRDALAGRHLSEDFEAPETTTEGWPSWLRRQRLSRLLRHDSKGVLRSDAARAARTDAQQFRLKGLADGQVDVEI